MIENTEKIPFGEMSAEEKTIIKQLPHQKVEWLNVEGAWCKIGNAYDLRLDGYVYRQIAD